MRLCIPAGSTGYLGRPARPMDPSSTEAVVALIGSFAHVQEAHLPQCWFQAVMTEAAQVLVVVIGPESMTPVEAASRIEHGVSQLLPRGSHLDVWFMTADDPLLDAVRRAGSKIFERNPSRKSPEYG
jgi:hypothetical protein